MRQRPPDYDAVPVKLGLGTAQFGFDYGVTNRRGQVPHPEVDRLIELAAERGITLLDTAVAYWRSETVLGAALRGYDGDSFRIVTKTAPAAIASGRSAAQETRQTCLRSLEKLGARKLYGLLVHHADDLLSPVGGHIWRELEQLRDEGYVEKIGVSAYTGEEINSLLERFPIQLVQLPLSILDQRLIQNGVLATLKSKGVEVHARSIFLQGLLLENPAQLAPRFSELGPHLSKVSSTLHELGLTILQGALAFPLSLHDVDVALVGVSGCAELREILDAVDGLPTENLDFSAFAFSDEAILNPSAWPTLN